MCTFPINITIPLMKVIIQISLNILPTIKMHIWIHFIKPKLKNAQIVKVEHHWNHWTNHPSRSSVRTLIHFEDVSSPRCRPSESLPMWSLRAENGAGAARRRLKPVFGWVVFSGKTGTLWWFNQFNQRKWWVKQQKRWVDQRRMEVEQRTKRDSTAKKWWCSAGRAGIWFERNGIWLGKMGF